MAAESRRAGGSPLEVVLRYHERTKHHPHRYARGPGYLDWANEPNPFRVFEGTERKLLDEMPQLSEPTYDAVFRGETPETRPFDLEAAADLLYHSVALSAWKESGGARWSLRVNPSSGDLHPTETYLLAGSIGGWRKSPGLYHYDVFHHALELRREIPGKLWKALAESLPGGTVFAGFTSIYWREAWKYGERAFRYAQLDMGHAIAAVSFAARLIGRRAVVLDALASEEAAALLGVRESRDVEREHAECILALVPQSAKIEDLRGWSPPRKTIAEIARLEVLGLPNRLSREHRVWEIIDEVARATERPGGVAERFTLPPPEEERGPARSAGARSLARRRRSAVDFDGKTSLPLAAFHGVVRRLLPARGHPFLEPLPIAPSIDLLLFVHRIEGLEPGLYAFGRTSRSAAELRRTFPGDFEWERPSGAPSGLPLFRLRRGDFRRIAGDVSCFQDIAADGAFAAAMLAEFLPRLEDRPWNYRRLHWEAGAVGQTLYLEAEACGLRGTGIGCYFDDPVHRLAGISDLSRQDLYHFTAGGAVDDPRLKTLPAYFHRRGTG